MNSATYIAYLAAGLSGGMAVTALFRPRRSLARWTFILGMALLAAESVLVGLCANSTSAQQIHLWQLWRVVVFAAAIAPWWLFSCTYARGDSSRFLRRNAAFIASLVVFPLLIWLDRDDLVGLDRSAPDSNILVLRLGWLGYVAHLVFLVVAIAIVMNLERTFRAAVGTTRWRIKFALIGVGLLFVTRVYTNSDVLLFRSLNLQLQTVNAGALIIAIPLIIWSYLRAGHFELDVYPSGPVLKNSLTVLLAGIYLLIVGVLAKAVAFLGGDASFALKTFFVLIAVVVLALGLQSDRLQLQLRRFVSRNFERPLHDYRAIWKKFIDRTAANVDRSDLCRTHAGLVAEVFEALSVRLWLLNDKRDLFTVAAATTQAPGDTDHPDAIEAAAIAAHFQAHPEPLDIETQKDAWCVTLRTCHPSDFPNGGHRVCVPLFGRTELLGIITIGDRVSGTPFTTQDFELLKCIADHAAAGLLNVELSQQLLQAKQLEAFQAMAAFFVHDLKNAASTLNLMLKNLPVHFDDPEFRADALRGIGKTVDHINRLIGRLSALRHELKVEPTDSDLNEVVDQALAGLGKLPHARLEKDIKPVPRVPFDRDQVHKVITNIILNAAEAAPPQDGYIRVSTGHENGWVVLTVDDNGCGMSEDFMEHSLFRPFQTTKKNGLGIGMFQSKMIVEAHGGRIAVSSRPGAGTKFQVYFRAPAQRN